MTRKQATATLVAKIKRSAKVASKAFDALHSDALEAGARDAGYANWHELQQAAAAPARGHGHREGGSARSVDDFPVDPVLPERFEYTRNESRSASELATWWDRPFAVSAANGGYTVRCLDGGAWDRSTYYGDAPDLAAAKALGDQKLAQWRGLRSKPTVVLDDDKVLVVRQPQHPHDDFTILKECATSEEASAFIRSLGK